jgi:hypothetical protein
MRTRANRPGAWDPLIGARSTVGRCREDERAASASSLMPSLTSLGPFGARMTNLRGAGIPRGYPFCRSGAG